MLLLHPQKKHWHLYKSSKITKSIYACSQRETAREGAKKTEATRANKQKTVDALACTSHQWSMLKLSDMCLPFLFLPRYSNCSMDGSSKSSPKRRGWICAFLCSITIPPDRQEHTYFQHFLEVFFFFYIVSVLCQALPTLLQLDKQIADVKYKTVALNTGRSFDALVAGSGFSTLFLLTFCQCLFRNIDRNTFWAEHIFPIFFF